MTNIKMENGCDLTSNSVLKDSPNTNSHDIFFSKIVIPAQRPVEDWDAASIETSEQVHIEAEEYAESMKDVALSKDRGLVWSTRYNKNENRFETGMQFCILDYREELANIESYNGKYVYLKEESTLLFICQNQIETVPVFDNDRFNNELEIIMNDVNDEYSIKHLTWQEINQLITENGGHTPHSLPSPERKETVVDHSDNSQLHFLKGGPPESPPVYGKKFTVHPEDEFKIDKEGCSYTGFDRDEQIQHQQNDSLNSSLATHGIFASPSIKEHVKSNDHNDALGKGGPPVFPLIPGKKVRIYYENPKANYDSKGRVYAGVCMDQLLTRERQNETSSFVTSHGLFYNLNTDDTNPGQEDINNKPTLGYTNPNPSKK